MEMNTASIYPLYSISGYLYMKPVSGAFSLLKPRRRMYFALEKTQNCLLYFKDDVEFTKKKDAVGFIQLEGAVCVLADSQFSFAIISQGRKYIFEAANAATAEHWLEALQNRRECLASITDEPTIDAYSRSCMSCSVSQSISSNLDSQDHSFNYHDYLVKHEPPNLRINCDNRYSEMNPETMPELERINIDNATHLGCARHCHNTTVTDHYYINTISTTSTCDALKLDADNFKVRSDVLHTAISLPCNLSCLTDLRKTNNEEKVNERNDDRKDWVCNWLNKEAASDRFFSTRNSYANRASSCSASSEMCSESSLCSENAITPPTILMCEKAITDELLGLRAITNRQKFRIQELNEEKKALLLENSQLKHSQNATLEALNDKYKASLAAQNKFLNAEIIRLSQRSEIEHQALNQLKECKQQMEDDLCGFKRDYAFLLQSCVQIPLSDQGYADELQVKLFGLNVHKRRVLSLLEEARSNDPTLPTFSSLTSQGNYVDEFGFRRTFRDDAVALHYICTLLYGYFRDNTRDQLEHKAAWARHLHKYNHQLFNTVETQRLVRRGIPSSLRTTVWKILIHQQIADIKKRLGKYYFRNVSNSHGTPAERQYFSNYQKQINLDLLRTMPNNVHFMSPTCKGIQQLEQVLKSYCMHNPSIGYCQGMNFIAGIAMLFVGAEDTFWFLVAITEKYFDPSYFDQTLTGAQASQEVLKELLETRLPRLAAHFDSCDIDLATITLNWFIALFFDTVPFQTLIRIWDCFLLEGPKVLYRFTLALLAVHEEEILKKTDTISVMKVLKASVRLTYDYDGLIKLAYDPSLPFPTDQQLETKQRCYLAILRDRLSRRREIRKMLSTPNVSVSTDNLYISNVTFGSSESEVGYLCSGNQSKGIISRIVLREDKSSFSKLQHEFDCRILSMALPRENFGFISLLSGYVVALRLDEGDCEVLWELKTGDIALKLLYHDDRLFAALANGTLTVIERAGEMLPSALNLYHLPISAAPIMDMTVVDNGTLWLAIACKVVVMSLTTMAVISRMYVASSVSTNSVPLFEKIRCMSASPHGVWLATAHSMLIQLWENSTCRLLFDSSFDHKQKKPSLSNEDDEEVEISSILYLEDHVWIGTTDGCLILYKVVTSGSKAKISACESSQSERYPAGRKLSPSSGSTDTVSSSACYYIPTEVEVRRDESISDAEYPWTNKKGKRMSVTMDEKTRKFYANRRVSADAFLTNRKETLTKRFAQVRPNSVDVPPREIQRRTITDWIMSYNQGKGSHLSEQSEASIFSSAASRTPLPEREESTSVQAGEIDENEGDLSKERLRLASLTSIGIHSPVQSSISMEYDYDDIFEVYADEKESDPPVPVSKCSIKTQMTQNGIPSVSNSPYMAFSKEATAIPYPPRTTSPTTSDITNQNYQPLIRNGRKSSTFRLRRKDLDVDEIFRPHTTHALESVIHQQDEKKSENEEEPFMDSSLGISLLLDMKLKIADRPVKCAQPTRIGKEYVVITCAGDYGDPEAVLKWTLDKEACVVDRMWINEPVVQEKR